MADTVSVTCPECGKKINMPEEILGRKVRCKGCGESFVARASRGAEKKKAEKKPEPAKKAPEKSPAKKAVEEDDEDSNPYGVTEEYLGPRCPECANAMEEGDKICLHCGYNTETRQRAPSKMVEELTGLDYFLWWLPGILCLIAVLALIGFDVWYCLSIADLVGDPKEAASPWYSVIAHGSVKMWLCIGSAFPVFYALMFAIKRLGFNYMPPEVEVKRKKAIG
jgi:hypothetical protein